LVSVRGSVVVGADVSLKRQRAEKGYVWQGRKVRLRLSRSTWVQYLRAQMGYFVL
jgi:hypothetical protein